MGTIDDSQSGENQHKETKTAYKEIDFEKSGHSLLTCPKCNHFISGKDINVEKTIAKCGHCDHVFGFSYDSSSSSLVPEPIIPEGIEELRLKSELDISLKWLSTTSKAGRAFYLVFTSFWNLIVLPFAVGAVLTGNWGILLFLSLHLAVGIGLLWYLASIYLNRTSINVTKHHIKVRTFPLRHPFWKSKNIETSNLQQLYVSKYVQSTSNGVSNYAYALYAILKTGEKVSLIRGMTLETQVYIEKAIEEYLDIKNTKVPDEVKV